MPITRRVFVPAALAAGAPPSRLRIAILGATHPHAPAKIKLAQSSARFELAGVVEEGARFDWNDFTIRVLDTPGMTAGAVSYLVEMSAGQTAHQSVVFCGDAFYAAGQVWDIHSLQKKMGPWSDYHGFLGAARTLSASLHKLAETEVDYAAPSHGSLIPEVAHSAQLRVAGRVHSLRLCRSSLTIVLFITMRVYVARNGEFARNVKGLFRAGQ